MLKYVINIVFGVGDREERVRIYLEDSNRFVSLVIMREVK